MTDKSKYKSVAIDKETYKKIEELTSTLSPGLNLSRAQVVKTLINRRVTSCKDTNQIIVGLFAEYTPHERQKVLEDIDVKMLELLEQSGDDLPWLNNSNSFSEKWVSLMENLRLVVAKFKYEEFQNQRILN
tara:strand:- start:477 stop:869 length:393 start_codon:yes stop_codon:yes gene_type:complete